MQCLKIYKYLAKLIHSFCLFCLLANRQKLYIPLAGYLKICKLHSVEIPVYYFKWNKKPTVVHEVNVSIT